MSSVGKGKMRGTEAGNEPGEREGKAGAKKR